MFSIAKNSKPSGKQPAPAIMLNLGDDDDDMDQPQQQQQSDKLGGRDPRTTLAGGSVAKKQQQQQPQANGSDSKAAAKSKPAPAERKRKLETIAEEEEDAERDVGAYHNDADDEETNDEVSVDGDVDMEDLDAQQDSLAADQRLNGAEDDDEDGQLEHVELQGDEDFVQQQPPRPPAQTPAGKKHPPKPITLKSGQNLIVESDSASSSSAGKKKKKHQHADDDASAAAVSDEEGHGGSSSAAGKKKAIGPMRKCLDPRNVPFLKVGRALPSKAREYSKKGKDAKESERGFDPEGNFLWGEEHCSIAVVVVATADADADVEYVTACMYFEEDTGLLYMPKPGNYEHKLLIRNKEGKEVKTEPFTITIDDAGEEQTFTVNLMPDKKHLEILTNWYNSQEEYKESKENPALDEEGKFKDFLDHEHKVEGLKKTSKSSKSKKAPSSSSSGSKSSSSSSSAATAGKSSSAGGSSKSDSAAPPPAKKPKTASDSGSSKKSVTFGDNTTATTAEIDGRNATAAGPAPVSAEQERLRQPLQTLQRGIAAAGAAIEAAAAAASVPGSAVDAHKKWHKAVRSFVAMSTAVNSVSSFMTTALEDLLACDPFAGGDAASGTQQGSAADE
jgi:hypothetical protein